MIQPLNPPQCHSSLTIESPLRPEQRKQHKQHKQHKQKGSQRFNSRLNYTTDKPMINFIEGKINIGEKNILAISDEELSTLAEEGLIEKRKDAVGNYYYVEDEAGGMRFKVIISLREKKIQWLRLHWSNSLMKGWNDVSVKGVKNEYHLLLNLVEKIVGRPPDIKKNREHTWSFKWGQVDVSFDLRAFQADIFMVPQ
jgi:hypothetical protein